MTDRNGQCLCAAVSFTARDVVSGLGACHCKMSQRRVGSAFLEIGATPGSLMFRGTVKSKAPSDCAERAWCDVCGSSVRYQGTHRKHDYHNMSGGLVDDAGGLELKTEIYVDVKPDGYAFAGEHETKTKAEVEAGFAAFVEGARK